MVDQTMAIAMSIVDVDPTAMWYYSTRPIFMSQAKFPHQQHFSFDRYFGLLKAILQTVFM
jgi:hypothetical protein